jgi:copper resistance protein B
MSRFHASTHDLRLRAIAAAVALGLTAMPAIAQHTDHTGHTPPVPVEEAQAKKKPAPAPAKKKPASVATDPHAGHTMAPAPATPAKKKPAAAPAPATPAKKKPAQAAADPHAGHTMTAPTPAAAANKKPAPAAPDSHAGHTMTAPTPAAPAKKKPAPAATDSHAGHTMTAPTPAPAAKEKPAPAAVDPHAGHAIPAPASIAPAAVTDPHAGHVMPTDAEQQTPMDHAAMGHEMPSPDDAPRTPIPVVTDADRAAAFPPVQGHAAHDKRAHSYWLIDRLEAWNDDEGTAVGWDATAWIGGDIHRVWLRSEGEANDGDIESADIEILGGRAFARWWDVVAGVRHDFGEGPSQTFAAIGVMGVAPGKYEVEATAYLGTSGQTALEVEAEYDTLLTNRLILQWRGEAGFFGKDDAERGIGSGLSTIEVGARLRYEVNRRFAPYVGVEYERAFGETADFRPQDHDTRVVVGVRIWF